MNYLQSIKERILLTLLSFFPRRRIRHLPKGFFIERINVEAKEQEDMPVTVLGKKGNTLVDKDGRTSRASNPEEFELLMTRQEEE